MARVLGLLLLTGYITDCNSASISCVAPSSSTTRFRVFSRKNQTGHCITQLHMIDGTGSLTTMSSSKGPWKVEIEHRTLHVCEDAPVQNIAELAAPPARVGTDYELLSGLGYYKVNTTPSDWRTALSTCDEEGAHLVILNSEPEAKAVERLFQNTPNSNAHQQKVSSFHVGANDIFEEGHFVTIFGDPLSETGFNAWLPNEPSNSGKYSGEDCVALQEPTKFNDVPCSTKLWFVCEQELY